MEIDDGLLAAIDAEVERRSAGIRRATRADVLRELIAEHLVQPEGKKVSVAGR